MKKHIIAVAVAAAFAAPAVMADTTLYGLANMSLDYIDVSEGTSYKRNSNGSFTSNATKNNLLSSNNFNVQSGSSRIGIKGSEKISKDLSAVYQAEFGVNMSEDGTALTSRNQYVGLSSKSFGTMIAGRHDTPMKLAISKYDLFGDQIGDNGNIAGAKYGRSAGFNLRAPNVVAYLTPNLAGFNATIAYVADHDITVNTPNYDINANQAFSVSAGYEMKKVFNVTVAYENHQARTMVSGTAFNNPNKTSEDAWMIGAGVTAIKDLTINALYQQMNDFDGLKTNVWGLGAGYTFGKKHTIKGQYYNASSDALADNQNMFALGYDFAMSKQTTLFAAYAYGDNGQSVWGDGHQGKTPITQMGDQDANAFSVGMKYKF